MSNRLYTMVMTSGKNVNGKNPSVLRSLDWWTVGIYVALLAFGWVSVCGACYSYGDTDIFSLGSRSGMQIVWIGSSLVLGFIILLLDDKLYDSSLAYYIYAFFLILLIITIFNPHEIKGSRSWLVITESIRLQPAEFAKFATALCLAKYMSTYGYDIHRTRDFVTSLAIIIMPMLAIILEKETGSALVYLVFLLMFYREGMTGSLLFSCVALVMYFVVGIRFADVPLWDTPTSLGVFTVLLLVQLFSACMVGVYCNDGRTMVSILGYCSGITLAMLLFSEFVIPFNLVYVQIALCALMLIVLIAKSVATRVRAYLLIAVFALGSIAFFYSADYVLNTILEPHQRVRINVLLGLEEDLAGAGYNVHQSKIAIGSGGIMGKGFLQGTQTKLKFVPEQDTDFIFCTVGEEEGFVGSAAVLLLFLALILRLIYLSERQSQSFGRIYGYSVMSIFLFHVFINVGMVLGLTPVIGIPLPFFSYGGSSLWGFTFLLFIFLRIDAGRDKRNG